jgi:hypothetical protein
MFYNLDLGLTPIEGQIVGKCHIDMTFEVNLS